MKKTLFGADVLCASEQVKMIRTDNKLCQWSGTWQCITRERERRVALLTWEEGVGGGEGGGGSGVSFINWMDAKGGRRSKTRTATMQITHFQKVCCAHPLLRGRLI